jgi:hypothetical protein
MEDVFPVLMPPDFVKRAPMRLFKNISLTWFPLALSSAGKPRKLLSITGDIGTTGSIERLSQESEKKKQNFQTQHEFIFESNSCDQLVTHYLKLSFLKR